MTRALVDTTVLYAAANSRASRHETALAIVRGADRGNLPSLIVSDPILIETMNGLTRDVETDVAVDVLDRLHDGSQFEIRREPITVWDTALDVFERTDRLSLADAVLVTSAQHHGIEYCYSFDDDFDGFDSFTRLVTPVDILPALKGEDSQALGYYGLQPVCSLGWNDPEVWLNR